MARKKEEQGLDIANAYSKIEVYIEENKQLLSYIIGGVALVIAGYFGYSKFILEPREEKAAKVLFRAQTYFAADSFRLALNGDGLYPGFIEITEDYSGTKAANLSNYYAGICYLKTGQFENAIEYLEDYNSDDTYTQSLAWGAIGDAFTELGQMDKGISWYKKASGNKPNKLLTPLFLLKAGMAMERTGRNKDAKEMYEEIKEKYPESPEGTDIEKYIARVDARI